MVSISVTLANNTEIAAKLLRDDTITTKKTSAMKAKSRKKLDYRVCASFCLNFSVTTLAIGALSVSCTKAPSKVNASSSSVQDQVLRTKPPSVDVQKTVRGYWVTEKGKLSISPAQGRIYEYDWYAAEPNPDGGVTLIWDNGLNCTRTKGQVYGNEIRLTAGDIETSLVVRDASHAIITFRHGKATYTKQLIKLREDPRVICM